MDIVNNIIVNDIGYIVIVLGILIVTLLIIIIINSVRLQKLKNNYKLISNGIEDKNLEEIINGYYMEVEKVIKKNSDIQEQIITINGNLEMCLKKVGVVRYNAFENVGSDLSFAVTTLDSNDNGFILNAVFSRESSIIYAKPVINGKSKYALSAEEVQSLDLAKKNYDDRDFIAK